MKIFLFSKKHSIILLAAIILVICIPSLTQAGFGDLNVGARSMGLGGAFVGLADDATAPLFNPAGIGEMQRLDILLNYSSLFGGLTNGSIYSGYAGVVIPTRSLGNFGVGFYQRGASIASKSLYTESVLALNFARKVNRLSFGLTTKVFMSAWDKDALAGNQYLADEGKTAIDFDLGIFFQPFQNLSLGFACENVIATDMAIGADGQDKLDRVLKPGLAFRIGERLSPYVQRYPGTIAADVTYRIRDQREAVSRIHLGIESWLISDGVFALRAGYATGDEKFQTITLGTSLRLTPVHPGLQLDYAYQLPSGNEERVKEVNTHRFALRFYNEPVIKKIDPSQIQVTLVAEPSMFSPNMDGRMDVTRLRPASPSELNVQSWSVKIFMKNTGDLIRTFEEMGLAPAELTWRGKDDSGMELPDGEYFGVHEVLSAYDGSFKSANTLILLDTTPPEVSVRAMPQTFMPLNEDGMMPNATTLRMTANDALSGTEAWNLFIRKQDSEENFRKFVGRGAPAEDIVWDGTDDSGNINYEGGSYVFVLEAVDKVGNRGWTEPDYVYTSTSVRPGPDQGTLQMIHQKIHFDFDKSIIKPESFPVLDKMVRELQKFSEYSLVISAHTDWMGTDEYNLGLSQRRAESVMEYLKAREAIHRVVEAKGYGESRPISNNETEEGRALNRRVELVLVPRQ